MSIAKNLYNNIAFWTSFDYLRLVTSASVAVAGPSTTSIPLPTGTGAVFVRVYWKPTGGQAYFGTGQYMTGIRYEVDYLTNLLNIYTVPGGAGVVSYFIRRSNA